MPNLDLFADVEAASPAEYQRAVRGWLSDSEKTGRLQRESSAEVYEHMWSAFTAWAVGNSVALAEIRSSDLAAYLASRGSTGELSSRYSWRFLRLVDRVLAHDSRAGGLAENKAAVELMSESPDIRFANAPGTEPLPVFLSASEAKRLVTYLSAVRPGRAASGQPRQDVRNRAAVGLMLGTGITPGEVRALELASVVIEGGSAKQVPWKLRVAGNGSTPSRETPVASWAGQLLRYWLVVRAEQSIPGSMLFPSTKRTGKPWGKVAQYNPPRRWRWRRAWTTSRAAASGCGIRLRSDSCVGAARQIRWRGGSACRIRR